MAREIILWNDPAGYRLTSLIVSRVPGPQATAGDGLCGIGIFLKSGFATRVR
jgi:hypothetical protein